jgi:uncharacterized protein YndB with AHSA1/START domain
VATNRIHVEVPRRTVWSVLADPRLYPNWVVGASSTRRVDGLWPAPGSVLHHTQAPALPDTTTVLDSVPGERLVLLARVGPLLVSRVTVELFDEDEGTRITFVEVGTGGIGALLPRPILDGLLWARNSVGIRRLKSLSEIARQLDLDDR